MVALSRVTGGVALNQIVIWSAEKNFTKKIWTPVLLNASAAWANQIGICEPI